ncbi:MAG TPA: glycosyltransferase family 2 protein [Phycisphaerae bacterium]|nr:glycosyltransferase family 2 protein [Phycisphaerae bacterium]
MTAALTTDSPAPSAPVPGAPTVSAALPAHEWYEATALPTYSMVVPMYNEADSVQELYDGLTRNLASFGKPYEIIFINDGSKDDTYARLLALAEKDPHVFVINLRRNFGQTPALAAGFDHARGEIIIAMDGDLQHDPNELPKFIAKINEGYDVVSGWREKRVDGLFLRRIPSKIANKLIRKISKVDIHDFGTTFKAYRRDLLQHITLYGDNHRFIPALAYMAGAKITEVPIKNIAAPYRPSNYGIGRTFRVMLDLLTIKFLNSYLTRPIHLFGKLGLASLFISGVIFVFLLIRKIFWHVSLVEAHGPLMILGVVVFFMAFMFFSTGLLAELISRVYFESQRKSIYTVREIRHGQSAWQGRPGRPVIPRD